MRWDIGNERCNLGGDYYRSSADFDNNPEGWPRHISLLSTPLRESSKDNSRGGGGEKHGNRGATAQVRELPGRFAFSVEADRSTGNKAMTRPSLWRLVKCMFLPGCDLYDEKDDPIVQEYKRITTESNAATVEINKRPTGHLVADIVRGVRAPDEPQRGKRNG